MTVSKTVGSSGRDYSTLALWQASLPSTLADNYIANLYNDSEFFDDYLILSGHTTSASFNILVTAAAGQSFIDNVSAATNPLKYDQSKGVGLRSDQNYLSHAPIQCNDAYVTFSRLQVSHAAGSYGNAVTCSSPAANLTFSQNLMVGGESNGAVFAINGSGVGHVVTNNIFIASRDSVGISLQNSTTNSMFFAFNTVCNLSNVSSTHAALKLNYNTFNLKNNAFFGFNTLTTGGGTFAFTTCMTDIASPPTGCTTVIYANQFVGTTSTAPDFRLKAGANCINAATADATYNYDILNTSRPQGAGYDIGAYEYPATVETITADKWFQPAAQPLITRAELVPY